ncbi:MAG: YfhO family protein [Acidobacteriota bacterium]
MPPWSLLDLVPGLYFAACAAAGLWALKRWFDALPKATTGLFLALVLALFGQELFGGQILLPVDNLRGFHPFRQLTPADPPGNHLQGDQIALFTPLAASARRALAAGRWPLWDADSGAGLPLLAIPETQLFHPFRLIALPLPLERAAGVVASLQVLTALSFAFLFFRRLGSSPSAATFAALAFGLGGFIQLWLGWPRGAVGALLPAVLYAVLRICDRGSRRDHALLIVTVLGILGAGDPEVAGYALVAAIGWLIFRLAHSAPAARPAIGRRALFAGLLAATITAPLLLPQSHWTSETTEAHVVRERSRNAQQQDPLGLTTLGTAEKRRQAFQEATARLKPLVAAGAYQEHRQALYPGPVNRNEDAAAFVGTTSLLLALLVVVTGGARRGNGFWIASGALAFCAILGLPPLPQLLDGLWPFGPSASFHRRLALFLALATAALAAHALDRLDRSRGRATLVAGGLGLAIWWGTPAGEAMWPALAVLILAWALLLGCPRRYRALALGILLTAELLLLHGGANPAMPRHLYFPTPPTIEFLQQARQQEPGSRLAATHRVLLPRMASIYGLGDVRPGRLQPEIYARLAGFLSAPEVDLDDPRLDLLGVRWLLTAPDADLPGEPSFGDASGQIWERPNPLPRLFLPPATELVGDQPWAQRLASLDPHRTALVRAGPERDTPWQASHHAASALEFRAVDDQRLTARIDLAEERLMASSIYQDGGWRLLVDGRRHPTQLANGPLLAAWLPAGDHSLELLYRPRRFLLGMLLAALGSAIAAAWLGAPKGRPTAV